MKRKKRRIIYILLFIVLLPLIIIEFVVKAVVKVFKRLGGKKKKFTDKEFYQNLSIEKVDIMDGITFEQFLKRLFIYRGYQVSDTARTGDYGADLVLKRDGEVTVVQAKRYNANVGARAIQEIYSARHHYKASKMMVVSNAHFTRQAIEMAMEQYIELIDREELISIMNEVKGEIEENLTLNEQQEFDAGKNAGGLENFKYRI